MEPLIMFVVIVAMITASMAITQLVSKEKMHTVFRVGLPMLGFFIFVVALGILTPAIIVSDYTMNMLISTSLFGEIMLGTFVAIGAYFIENENLKKMGFLTAVVSLIAILLL